MTMPDAGQWMALDPQAMSALCMHYAQRAQQAEALVVTGHRLLKGVALQNGGRLVIEAAALREVTDETPIHYEEQPDGSVVVTLPTVVEKQQ